MHKYNKDLEYIFIILYIYFILLFISTDIRFTTRLKRKDKYNLVLLFVIKEETW